MLGLILSLGTAVLIAVFSYLLVRHLSKPVLFLRLTIPVFLIGMIVVTVVTVSVYQSSFQTMILPIWFTAWCGGGIVGCIRQMEANGDIQIRYDRIELWLRGLPVRLIMLMISFLTLVLIESIFTWVIRLVWIGVMVLSGFKFMINTSRVPGRIAALFLNPDPFLFVILPLYEWWNGVFHLIVAGLLLVASVTANPSVWGYSVMMSVYGIAQLTGAMIETRCELRMHGSVKKV